MKRTSACWPGILLAVVMVVLLPLVACSMGSGARSSFCDAGESDLDFSGAAGDFFTYSLFRLDTGAAPRTLRTPGAAEMIDYIPSATVGQVMGFAVAADGFNAVIIAGGEGVTVRPGASVVEANTTRLLFCVIDSTEDHQLTVY